MARDFFLKQKTVDEYNLLPFRMAGHGFVALDKSDEVIDP